MRAEERLPAGAWMAAGGATTMLLIVSARYGFHRDELYFMVAGRNLDWGYVDQPPFTPLVARLSELALGVSPTALRVLPALAVGAVALLAASMTRRFGGGRVAQAFAALTAGWVGVLLGEGHLLSTAVFDYFFWTASLWILLGLLDGADRRWWLALGATIGIGLQNKHTIAFLAVAILAALLISKRRNLLAGPLPWLGAGIAGLIAGPNLIWQAANGWPQFEMARALRERSDGPLMFILEQPLLLSVTLIVPAMAGLWWFVRSDEADRWRPIAIVYGLLFLFFLVTGGKSYYVAPMNSVLLAAGAVWFERLGRKSRVWVGSLSVLGIVVGLFIALPLVPPGSLNTVDFTGELSETVGWPDLVEQIDAVYGSIPSDRQAETVIFTGSYGEAGAVDVLGPALGLPAAASGHNNYWLWGPPDERGPIIGVGHVEAIMESVCLAPEQVEVISNPDGVENEEFGLPIFLCLDPSVGLADVWEASRHYN